MSTESTRHHILSVLVENKPGVLAQVRCLVSRPRARKGAGGAAFGRHEVSPDLGAHLL